MTLMFPRRLVVPAPPSDYSGGLAPLWRAAAIGAGLSRDTPTVTGPTTVTPKLTAAVPDGRDLVLTLRPLPGQLPDDYRAAAVRLAAGLNVARVAVEPVTPNRFRLRLLRRDPLADPVRLPASFPRGLVGWAEDGLPIVVPVRDRPHTVVQGQTGSGKSVWTYCQLAGVAGDRRVLVAGLDPTGLLFRPFTGSRHAPWQVSGLADGLAEHVALLERLCAVMDQRIADLPADRDSCECTPARPAFLVVLEELAAVYRTADLESRDTGKRVRALVGRLLAEGRKAGIRLLLIVQRADAALIDGMARAQCGLRVSFSVDSPEAVRMLHPAAADPSDVLGALPGVGVLTAPGQPLLRFRAPWLPTYGEYVARVRAALS